MKNDLQYCLIVLVLLTLTSCGNGAKNESEGAAGPGAAAGDGQIKDYRVLALQPRTATLNSDYPASIQGQQNIEIRPRIDGYIEKIYVDEGAVVKKGQLLFKINAPQYEQEVRTATASIKSAEADVSAAAMAVNKVKPLVEKDIVSKYELESAEYTYQARQAVLAQAQAALANARTNLGYTSVTSPVDGVVGSIPFRLGSLVNGSTAEPLTTVSSIGNIYAYFAFNEKLLLDFVEGDPKTSFTQKLAKLPAVSLLLADGDEYAYKGKIQTVNGLINTETGSVNVRADFPNPNGLIRSGSSATVRIPNEVKDALLIPQSATYELQDKRFAVVLGKDGKTKSVAITIMQNTVGNFYVVTTGLKASDKIVLEGVGTLKDGTQIKATEVSADSIYADLK